MEDFGHKKIFLNHIPQCTPFTNDEKPFIVVKNKVLEKDMIIACPECASRFAVQQESLGVAGRFVRCARCLHIWFQMPGDETQPTFDTNPAKNPVSGKLPSLSVDFKPKNRLWTTALTLSFMSMAVLLALVMKKDWISETFPQTTPYYQVIL
jgi:predicted Zn finger-like uncharacterized protein